MKWKNSIAILMQVATVPKEVFRVRATKVTMEMEYPVKVDFCSLIISNTQIFEKKIFATNLSLSMKFLHLITEVKFCSYFYWRQLLETLGATTVFKIFIFILLTCRKATEALIHKASN